MSSVLIKDMELPAKCDVCRLRHNTLAFCNVTGKSTSHNKAGKPIDESKRPTWCPLVDGEIYEKSLHGEILRYGEVYDSKGNRYAFK